VDFPCRTPATVLVLATEVAGVLSVEVFVEEEVEVNRVV
jgi:hypothetical protein